MVQPSLYDYSTKLGWDDLWDIDAETGGHPAGRGNITLNYHSKIMVPYYRTRADVFVDAFGWDRDTRLVFVGCGFCWTGEILMEEHGLSKVIGTEMSPYIQANKKGDEDDDILARMALQTIDLTSVDGVSCFVRLRRPYPRSKMPVDILDEELDTVESRNRVKDAIGGPGYVVMTHDGYIDTCTDAEATQLSADLNAMAGIVGNVIHYTYPGWAGNTNRDTLQKWKDHLPGDTFIEDGTWAVL